jgi:drug/metabolite transporter superfamily protein YnfA
MTHAIAILRSLLLFVAAGLCEVGGAWLIWKRLRSDWRAWWGLLGAVLLVLYGIVPTVQAIHFGRVYSVYGDFFSLYYHCCGDGTSTATGPTTERRTLRDAL